MCRDPLLMIPGFTGWRLALRKELVNNALSPSSSASYGRKEKAQDNRAVMLAIAFCLRYTLPLCHG